MLRAGRTPHNWEETLPLTFTLEGDMLRGTLDPSRLHRSSASELERERRLYLRLADLVREGDDGRPHLRPGWKSLARDLANLYAPVMPCDVVPYRLLPGLTHTEPFRESDAWPQEGLSVCYIGEEALRVWWWLRLRDHLHKQRPSLQEALKAVAHLLRLHRVLFTGLATSMTGHLVPEREGAIPLVRTRATDMGTAEGDGYAFLLRPMSVREANSEVARLRDAIDNHQRALWTLAAGVLSLVLNEHLFGVWPECSPAADGRNLPSPGFYFEYPLARVWYGVWEDLAGLHVRSCPNCGRFFFASRKDQSCCSPRCATAERVRKHREKKAAQTTKQRPKRHTRRKPKS